MVRYSAALNSYLSQKMIPCGVSDFERIENAIGIKTEEFFVGYARGIPARMHRGELVASLAGVFNEELGIVNTHANRGILTELGVFLCYCTKLRQYSEIDEVRAADILVDLLDHAEVTEDERQLLTRRHIANTHTIIEATIQEKVPELESYLTNIYAHFGLSFHIDKNVIKTFWFDVRYKVVEYGGWYFFFLNYLIKYHICPRPGSDLKLYKPGLLLLHVHVLIKATCSIANETVISETNNYQKIIHLVSDKLEDLKGILDYLSVVLQGVSGDINELPPLLDNLRSDCTSARERLAQILNRRR